jgi:DNA/RNA endonuclease G (NUC1)
MLQLASLAGRRRCRAVAVLAVLAAGCTDQPTGIAPVPVPAGPGAARALTCTITVSTGALVCAEPGAGTVQGVSSAIYGGQNSLVRLSSANAHRTGDVFEVEVTVTNLLEGQAIGTVDGVTPHAAGTRVFFFEGPVAPGSAGEVSLANADGDAWFTTADQPYFQYDGVIATSATSAARPWRFNLAPDVHTFSFKVLIATEAQARLVISELMANPGGAVQDSVGEYVEVYNAGRFPVNLRGFYLRDNGTAADTVKSDVVVAAGGYAVLARSTDTAKNGGVPADYAYTTRIGTTSTNLTFSNSGADRFVIRSAAGVLLDSVSYTGSGTVAKAGIARELQDLTADNTLVDGAGWADATSVYDVTNNNRGTPGTAPSGGGGGTPAGPVATVSVSPGNATLQAGQNRQYTATGRDGSGQASPTTFTWASTDTLVARVSASGMVTTVADGTASIRATSANGIMGATTLTVFTPASGAVYRNHAAFGTPVDGDASDDILLSKQTFSLSYNSARGGPNWVSWNLNASHFGAADRCDCFSADATLPAGASMIVTSDYTGSGYSRGHMVMSEQRTQSDAENASTFLMTNILPQLQDMNGGPWLKFEIYTNDLARIDGREVYNVAGGLYGASPSTLKGEGKVAIPTHTWKIIVVMNGGEGLADVASASSIQVIAVSMPNAPGIQANDWPMYRTSVDALEAATGYDFLAALPDDIEAVVEAASN